MNTEHIEKFVNAIACDLEEGGFRQVSGTTLRRSLTEAVSAALPLLEAGNPVSSPAGQGDDLLPCPFCGNNVEFVPYKNNGLTVKCKSMGCIQRHQRTLRYGIEWLRASMTEHWNARALAARQPGAQVPVAEVSGETFNDDGTSDIIKPALAIGTKLYAAPPAQGIDLGPGVRAIADERQRQVDAEGYNAENDADYKAGELANAALAYVEVAAMDLAAGGRSHIAMRAPPACWPWHRLWWKPRDARRDLVRAGALIAAQLDVIDSASDAAPGVE